MGSLLTRRTLLLATASLTGCARLRVPTAVFPGAQWDPPVGAGLRSAPALGPLLRSGDTTSMMVVRDGRCVFSYGDVSELSYLASARKSLVSMLYGPSV